MKPTSITIDRTFVLGAVGKAGAPETVRFAVTWGLEGDETLEQAEEKGAAAVYEMAARERKRRYGSIRAYEAERRAEEKRRAAETGAPAVAEAGGAS